MKHYSHIIDLTGSSWLTGNRHTSRRAFEGI
jgi:hypothetical protein